jgi:hypothetical protein
MNPTIEETNTGTYKERSSLLARVWAVLLLPDS